MSNRIETPVMPWSPLDALINCLHDVRKAAKVKLGDTVGVVDQRIADVFLPIVKRIQFEAAAAAQDEITNLKLTNKELLRMEAEAVAAERQRCAGDVCDGCRENGRPLDTINEDTNLPSGNDGGPRFVHRCDSGEDECSASAIWERVSREGRGEN